MMKGGDLVNPPGTFCNELKLHATMLNKNFFHEIFEGHFWKEVINVQNNL
jgi:hypothetical protein